jgi:hypothetical protein
MNKNIEVYDKINLQDDLKHLTAEIYKYQEIKNILQQNVKDYNVEKWFNDMKNIQTNICNIYDVLYDTIYYKFLSDISKDEYKRIYICGNIHYKFYELENILHSIFPDYDSFSKYFKFIQHNLMCQYSK